MEKSIHFDISFIETIKTRDMNIQQNLYGLENRFEKIGNN